MLDSFGREIDYIRISVTDRCNLRCVYCMPEDGISSLSHYDVLRFEEIFEIASCAAKLGIKKIKLTGGEPLVRRGILPFVKNLHEIDGIENITMTSNGVLIEQYKDELASCGLDGINISLDTLNRDKYEQITRRDELSQALKAIDICENMGIKTKINCVAMSGFNEDELCNIARFAKNRNLFVRFIEMMPLGMGKQEKRISNEEILNILESRFGTMQIDEKIHGNGPAVYYKPQGFVGSIGIISAVSNCFCSNCNKVRLTAEGFLKLCLQYDSGVDLKTPLRNGVDKQELKEIMRKAIYEKPRQHTFSDLMSKKNIECKGMSQIGG